MTLAPSQRLVGRPRTPGRDSFEVVRRHSHDAPRTVRAASTVYPTNAVRGGVWQESWGKKGRRDGGTEARRQGGAECGAPGSEIGVQAPSSLARRAAPPVPGGAARRPVVCSGDGGHPARHASSFYLVTVNLTTLVLKVSTTIDFGLIHDGSGHMFHGVTLTSHHRSPVPTSLAWTFLT